MKQHTALCNRILASAGKYMLLLSKKKSLLGKSKQDQTVFVMSQEAKQRELDNTGEYFAQSVVCRCILLHFRFIPAKKLRATSPNLLLSF